MCPWWLFALCSSACFISPVVFGAFGVFRCATTLPLWQKNSKTKTMTERNTRKAMGEGAAAAHTTCLEWVWPATLFLSLLVFVDVDTLLRCSTECETVCNAKRQYKIRIGSFGAGPSAPFSRYFLDVRNQSGTAPVFTSTTAASAAVYLEQPRRSTSVILSAEGNLVSETIQTLHPKSAAAPTTPCRRTQKHPTSATLPPPRLRITRNHNKRNTRNHNKRNTKKPAGKSSRPCSTRWAT